MDKDMLDYNIKVRLPIIVLVVLITYFATFFYSFDERNLIGYAPEQPINFSHKLHAGEMGLDCRYCHSGVEKSRHSNIPSVDTCMNCHSVVKTDSPEIKKLTDYYKNDKPLEWARIHRQPGHVYFNHSVHINKGVDCSSCHGNVNEMDIVHKNKKLTMGHCLDCHRESHTEVTDHGVIRKHQGPQHCTACHR